MPLKDIKQKIETVFRFSNNSDEIFDAVDAAVHEKISDTDLYKILLGNAALSKDEIILFTEKLSREFPECCYDLYMWTAKIFGSSYLDHNNLEKSLHYLKKASEKEPAQCEPYLAALKLYNYDLELPTNEKVIEMMNHNSDSVKDKTIIYSTLADHYERIGDVSLKRKYRSLAEKYRHQ